MKNFFTIHIKLWMLSVACIFLLSGLKTVTAQPHIVGGVVSHANGEVLSGDTLKLLGTNLATSTHENGIYRLR